MATTSKKMMITDVFVNGAFQGWNIATHSTIPNVLMAFVIIKMLNISGAVDGTQLAIVIPAIYLMGSQVQYMGRCLGVIGIQGSDMFKIMAVPPIVALLSLWVMRLVVLGS